MYIVAAEDSPFFRQYLNNYIPRLKGVSKFLLVATTELDLRGMCTEVPDILVIDPFVSGNKDTQLILTLREHLPDTMLIIFTDQANERLGEACCAAGSDHFLIKSMGPEYLGYILRSLIQKKQVDEEGAEPNPVQVTDGETHTANRYWSNYRKGDSS